jgi:ankyrin repeat protein
MKYIKLFENFEPHDPHELMMIPSYKKAEMIVDEIKKDVPNLNLVSDLIVLGANVDWQDEDNFNRTPLHVAVINGQLEIAQVLLDAGADVNVQTNGGRTPLHDAAQNGSLEIARMLIDAGARKDIRDNEGKLPYDLARTPKLKNLLKP